MSLSQTERAQIAKELTLAAIEKTALGGNSAEAAKKAVEMYQIIWESLGKLGESEPNIRVF